MTRSPPRPRAYAPDPGAPGRLCDMPNCASPGGYRAPKSRTELNNYHWFCLDHVRAYNAGWDFYKGMTPGQIEAQLRADTSWQRPTWPLGHLGGHIDESMLRDPNHVLNAGMGGRKAQPAPRGVPGDLREPMAVLGLDWPVTLDLLKSRYKDLAKQHHPDANGGDRDSEERLKTINLAYAAVRGRLLVEPEVAG
jgi:hypothetical protein